MLWLAPFEDPETPPDDDSVLELLREQFAPIVAEQGKVGGIKVIQHTYIKPHY